MIRAFYSGTAGMKAQQTSVDVIANNIANINTTGYASRDTRFSDLLHASMLEPEDAAYAAIRTGSGDAADSVRADMSAGGMVETDRPLDYCPRGEGFFAVQGQDGAIRYTRDGAFSAGAAGGTYLVDSQGASVLDAAGNPVTVGADGRLSAEPGVFTFPAASGLQALGDNRYLPTDVSGAAQGSGEGVRAGYLAASNVDLGGQMTDLILSQRGYQLGSRVVQTADQIANMTNSLR